MLSLIDSQNIKKLLKERLIGCWYGYNKIYPWVRKNYEINLWIAGEGPQAWCSSSRGARVELLLQISESHLYFPVNSMIYLHYQCEMWITECVYSRWKLVVWIAKLWNEKCDLRRKLAYIQCMLRSRPGKGITLHRLLWGDNDDTSEIDIGNVISKNNHGWSHKVWNESWKWQREQLLIVE
jgi:hypothetical protein